MKISVHSWHYRLLKWTFGLSYFYGAKGQKAVALCPYFWSTVLAILICPGIMFVRHASKMITLPKVSNGLMTNVMYIIRYAAGAFDLGLGVIGLINHDYLAGWLMVSLGFFILFGVQILKPIMNWHFDRQFEKLLKDGPKPKKEKTPNLMIEMLKAKKNKICPLLEFVE